MTKKNHKHSINAVQGRSAACGGKHVVQRVETTFINQPDNMMKCACGQIPQK